MEKSIITKFISNQINYSKPEYKFIKKYILYTDNVKYKSIIWNPILNIPYFESKIDNNFMEQKIKEIINSSVDIKKNINCVVFMDKHVDAFTQSFEKIFGNNIILTLAGDVRGYLRFYPVFNYRSLLMDHAKNNEDNLKENGMFLPPLNPKENGMFLPPLNPSYKLPDGWQEFINENKQKKNCIVAICCSMSVSIEDLKNIILSIQSADNKIRFLIRLNNDQDEIIEFLFKKNPDLGKFTTTYIEFWKMAEQCDIYVNQFGAASVFYGILFKKPQVKIDNTGSSQAGDKKKFFELLKKNSVLSEFNDKYEDKNKNIKESILDISNKYDQFNTNANKFFDHNRQEIYDDIGEDYLKYNIYSSGLQRCLDLLNNNIMIKNEILNSNPSISREEFKRMFSDKV